jgi:tRNA nucleotidyltransferase (CCA-adding enzyme)
MDIALANIMGLAFAEHLALYAQSKGIETGRIAKIQQNPDQSKHLETATLKVFGRDIDLVNLRSEEYAEGSRIPTGVVSRFYFPPQLSFIILRLSEHHWKMP